MSRQGIWEDERGFTLVEVVITVVLMGIVLGIATSTWFGVIESRRVDSATNQLAADLRQAQSKATNRLALQTVTLAGGSSEYTMTGAAGTFDLDEDPDEDVVAVKPTTPTTTVTFNPNGSATVTGANPITVESTKDPDKYHNTIAINITTSRVQVAP